MSVTVTVGAAQQERRPLDPAALQVTVRRLAEVARNVQMSAPRTVGDPRQGRHGSGSA
jgi:hypothetical protein